MSVRALLDTSVLIAADPVPPGYDAAISAVSIAALHFGLLVARSDEQRALRATRLGLVEARFPDPIALDDRVAREWGRLQAAVVARGGQPRRRMADLALAATATVHGAVLLTRNLADSELVADLCDVRAP